MAQTYYAEPAMMTSPGAWTGALDDLPHDLAGLCGVIQGLLMHEHWARAYGVVLSPNQAAQSHLRPVERTLGQILGRDGAALTVPRAPATRTVGVCRHYAVLLCAMLRHQGVPARSRCGFGAYFRPGTFEDHWVCEYWNPDQARWMLVDSQIDALQKGVLGLSFDLLDVPRDQFIVAGDAWRQYRAGEADADRFGIFDERGPWFIGGNVLRDFAALNNMEMLPWDAWGAMYEPGEAMGANDLELLDEVARLTLAGDGALPEIHELYAAEARVRVPATVFNAVRGVVETV